jgi:hypothetical protein
MTSLFVGNAMQEIQYGRGELVGFDFARIEADLTFALMPSINPVAFAVEEFLFRVSCSLNMLDLHFVVVIFRCVHIHRENCKREEG